MSWWRRGPTHSRTGPQRTALLAHSATRASLAVSPTAGCCQDPCARTNDRGGACVSRDWAATPRTGRGAQPAEEKTQKERAAAKTSALVAPRADALTDRTTTYSAVSAVSDPSQLGSEPDSWLSKRSLRAHERSGWCVREQRLGSHAPNRQRSTAGRTTTKKNVPQQKLVRWWHRGATHSRTGSQRTGM